MSDRTEYHVAQLNVAVTIAPTDDPAVAEFMDNLERINALADSAEGFVWRLQTDEGNATDIQIFPNPRRLVNMSVWESVETLKAYVYRTEHIEFFRRRAEWFEADDRRVALWSVAPGTIPSLEEAVRRADFLERHGPSPYSFGFAKPPAPLLFGPADPGDAAVETLLARLGSPDRAQSPDVICARYDGRPVGVAAPRGTESMSTAAAVVVDASVDGLLVDLALHDQLELAADAAAHRHSQS